jgi:hypothetical protein
MRLTKNQLGTTDRGMHRQDRRGCGKQRRFRPERVRIEEMEDALNFAHRYYEECL